MTVDEAVEAICSVVEVNVAFEQREGWPRAYTERFRAIYVPPDPTQERDRDATPAAILAGQQARREVVKQILFRMLAEGPGGPQAAPEPAPVDVAAERAARYGRRRPAQ